MFLDAAGVDVKHIPYKGVGPQVADIIGGQVEMGVVAVPAVAEHIKSGKLRAIGIMGKQRVASLPTCRRSPSRAFPTSTSPAGSPSSARPSCRPTEVKRLHDAVVAAFATPEVKAAMAKQENVINPDDAGSVGGVLQDRAGALCAGWSKKADIKLD